MAVAALWSMRRWFETMEEGNTRASTKMRDSPRRKGKAPAKVASADY